MLGKNLWVLFTGSVELTVVGGNLTSFINRLLQAGIRPWMIQADGRSMNMFLTLADVRKIRPHVRASRVRVSFGRRRGIPFWIGQARRRKAFVAGFLCFVTLLLVATSLVWQIDVVGTKKLSPLTVVEAAKELGIRPGVWKHSLLDADTLQGRLLDKVPELSWAGVHVHGMRVTIELVEKVPSNELKPPGPQNIVADKRGTVEHIFVKHGVSAVSRGTVVEPGQLLISGTMPDGKAVGAEGEVMASVWYVSHVTLPTQTSVRVLTGNEIRRDYVMLGSLPLQVTGYQKIPYSHVDEQSIDKEVDVRGWVVPVKLRTTYYREYQEKAVQRSQTELRQQALELAMKDVSTRMAKDGRMVQQQVLHMKVEHGKLYATVLTDVVEDIGKGAPLTS